MCGIWGLFTRRKNGFTFKEQEMMKQMMLMTAMRGDHSTGLFVIPNDGLRDVPKVWKDVGGPYKFLHNKAIREPFEELIDKKGAAVVGHGRYATVGTISIENAHPFQVDDITLVHNGNISSGVDKYKDANSTVDSHLLTKAIADKGVVEALNTSFGAYAVVMHDKVSGQIFLIRNDSRPLHMAWVHGRETLLVMSEIETLKCLLERNKFIGEQILFFKPDILYSLDLERMELKEAADIREVRQERFRREDELRKAHVPVYGPTPAIKDIRDIGRYKKGIKPPKRVVSFEVIEIKQLKSGFKYICITDENYEAFFIRTINDPSMIGKKGLARVNNFSTEENGDYVFFVKHKEITWKEELDKQIENAVQEAFPEAVPGGAQPGTFFLGTRGGTKLSREQWKFICDKMVCVHCDERVGYRDNKTTFVDSLYRPICKDCCHEIEAAGHDLKQYTTWIH